MEELAKDYEGLKRQYLALRSIVNAKERTLAKANERVRKLEALAEERAEFIINASNMASSNDVYKRCKFPLKAAADKFAIEKKIEGMQRILDCRELNLSEGEVDTIKLIQEQLRKEKE